MGDGDQLRLSQQPQKKKEEQDHWLDALRIRQRRVVMLILVDVCGYLVIRHWHFLRMQIISCWKKNKTPKPTNPPKVKTPKPTNPPKVKTPKPTVWKAPKTPKPTNPPKVKTPRPTDTPRPTPNRVKTPRPTNTPRPTTIKTTKVKTPRPTPI